MTSGAPRVEGEQLLLDTHAILWLLDADRRLPNWLTTVVAQFPGRVAISDVSLWEIAIKSAVGKLAIREDLPSVIAASDHQRLTIDEASIWRTRELPLIHRDPFDRLLIAQAIEHGRTLVTTDRRVTQYSVATRW